MMTDYLEIKTTLNPEETLAVKHLSETTCGDVTCKYCPFMLENTNGKCLRTLANEVYGKLSYDPRSRQAYTTHRV